HPGRAEHLASGTGSGVTSDRCGPGAARAGADDVPGRVRGRGRRHRAGRDVRPAARGHPRFRADAHRLHGHARIRFRPPLLHRAGPQGHRDHPAGDPGVRGDARGQRRTGDLPHLSDRPLGHHGGLAAGLGAVRRRAVRRLTRIGPGPRARLLARRSAARYHRRDQPSRPARAVAVWKDRTSEMNDASAAPDALVGAGVEFAVDGDRRPTTAPLQQVLAAGADEVSADLAGRLRTTADWRTDYAPLLAELTGACAGDPAAAVAMARAGVDRARAELVWTDPAGERPLTALTETDWDVEAPGTEVITGRGEPETELVVPYRGERLRGAALHARLEAWTAAGIVEPSFAAAVGAVIDNPRWLALPGRTIAMVGAGGEMSPLAPLTRWGADVLAVDLPQARVQAHIRDLDRKSTRLNSSHVSISYAVFC